MCIFSLGVCSLLQGVCKFSKRGVQFSRRGVNSGLWLMTYSSNYRAEKDGGIYEMLLQFTNRELGELLPFLLAIKNKIYAKRASNGE